MHASRNTRDRTLVTTTVASGSRATRVGASAARSAGIDRAMGDQDPPERRSEASGYIVANNKNQCDLASHLHLHLEWWLELRRDVMEPLERKCDCIGLHRTDCPAPTPAYCRCERSIDEHAAIWLVSFPPGLTYT